MEMIGEDVADNRVDDNDKAVISDDGDDHASDDTDSSCLLVFAAVRHVTASRSTVPSSPMLP